MSDIRSEWLNDFGVDIAVLGEVEAHRQVMRQITQQADATRHPNRIVRHGNLDYTVYEDGKPSYRVCASNEPKPFSQIINY